MILISHKMSTDWYCWASAANCASWLSAIATVNQEILFVSFLPKKLQPKNPSNACERLNMRKEYDFTKTHKNPDAAHLKK